MVPVVSSLLYQIRIFVCVLINVPLTSKEENKAANVLMDGFSAKIFSSKRLLVNKLLEHIHHNLSTSCVMSKQLAYNISKICSAMFTFIMCVCICIMMTGFTYHASFQILGFH